MMLRYFSHNIFKQIHLELRFFIHTAAANIWSVYVAERFLERIVHSEARSDQAEILLHAADDIRTFHRNFLRKCTRRCEIRRSKLISSHRILFLSRSAAINAD